MILKCFVDIVMLVIQYTNLLYTSSYKYLLTVISVLICRVVNWTDRPDPVTQLI